MDNRQANINRFEAEMAKVTRDGVDKLMAFIRKSDMYAAPASTRFHLSVTGGLLQHSLNVLDALRANLTKNDDGTYSYEVAGVPAARVTEENVIIMALLHDICKTYFYTTEIRNRKVNGKWEQYEAFAVDDKIPYGHGEKSVMMIEEYMKLQPVERYAIRWHMGYTEADTLSFNNAIDRYPMIWALRFSSFENMRRMSLLAFRGKIPKSSLYKMDGAYYLILDFTGFAKEEMRPFAFGTIEYDDAHYSDQGHIAHIREQGICIMKKQALEMLMQL